MITEWKRMLARVICSLVFLTTVAAVISARVQAADTDAKQRPSEMILGKWEMKGNLGVDFSDYTRTGGRTDPRAFSPLNPNAGKDRWEQYIPVTFEFMPDGVVDVGIPDMRSGVRKPLKLPYRPSDEKPSLLEILKDDEVFVTVSVRSDRSAIVIRRKGDQTPKVQSLTRPKKSHLPPRK